MLVPMLVHWRKRQLDCRKEISLGYTRLKSREKLMDILMDNLLVR